MGAQNAVQAMQLLTNFLPSITGSGTTTTNKQGGLNGATAGQLTGQLTNGTYSSGQAATDTHNAVQSAIKMMMQQYAPAILNQSRNAGSYNSSQTQNAMNQLESTTAVDSGKITADQISQYQQNQTQLAGVLSNNASSQTSATSPLDFTKLIMPVAAGIAGNAALGATGLDKVKLGQLATGNTSSLPGWLGGTGDLTNGASVMGADLGASGVASGAGIGTAGSMLAPAALAPEIGGITSGAGLLAGEAGVGATGMLTGGVLSGAAADAALGTTAAIGADLGGTAAAAGTAGELGALAGTADAALGAAAGGEAAAATGSTLAELLPIILWIICTELKDQGKLKRSWWKYGLIYFNIRYNHDAIRAYLLWATPVVKHMKKYPNGKLNKLMEIIFINRAEWIAADYLDDAKKTWKGFLGYWAAEIFTILVGVITLNKGVITHWFGKEKTSCQA